MRARTEDLLKIRDGEPIDAALRERLMAEPDTLREIERLTRVAAALRALPPLEPPDRWERVVEAAAPCTRRNGSGRRRAAAWGAVAAAAAAAAVIAVLIFESSRVGPERPAAEPQIADARSLPSLDTGSSENGYSLLVAESIRLERLLSSTEPRRRMMNAGTARTIVELEDRIAVLDEQLSYAEARDADPRFRYALWQERIDVMNALLHVRYAQMRHPPAIY